MNVQEHNSRVYGLVAPLYEQGKVLADHLTNKRNERIQGINNIYVIKKFLGVAFHMSAGQIVENAEIKRY